MTTDPAAQDSVAHQDDAAPQSAAAWIPTKKARLRVGPAPVPVPRADEIVVANRAVAVNPVDWVIQDTGSLIFSWLRHPFVLRDALAVRVPPRWRVGS